MKQEPQTKQAPLWDWSVRAYAAPGVKEALLALQDGFGADVPLLLWAAREATAGRGVPRDLAQRARTALTALRTQTRALRDARRAVPELAAGLEPALAEAAKAKLAEAELALEALSLARLDRFDGEAAAGDLFANVAAALEACGLDLAQREAAAACARAVRALTEAG